MISCGLLRFRSSGSGSRTKGFRVVREGRGQAGRSGLAPESESSGGGEGSARRQPREGAGEARRCVDNGIPGTKHNNKAFAFIKRAPAAASGSPAGGGVRRRSAAEAPHPPGRAALPDASRSHGAPRRPPGGGAARLGARRVSSPSPGPVPRGSGTRGRRPRARRKGWGGGSVPGGSGHPLGRASSPLPGVRAPRTRLAPGSRPCPWALRAFAAGAEKGRRREGFGAAGAARGREACALLSRPLALPPPDSLHRARTPRGRRRAPPWQLATPRS